MVEPVLGHAATIADNAVRENREIKIFMVGEDRK
jgi:hypothetical protein